MRLVPLNEVNERLRAFRETKLPYWQYKTTPKIGPKTFPRVIGVESAHDDRYGLQSLEIGKEAILEGQPWERMMRNILCLVKRKKEVGILPKDYQIGTKKLGEMEIKYWRKS